MSVCLCDRIGMNGEFLY